MEFRCSATSLRELGWPHVLEALAGYCKTTVGKERAQYLGFLKTDEIAPSWQTIEQARLLLERGQTLPVGGLSDIRSCIDRAEKDAVLAPEELLAVARHVQAGDHVRALFSQHASVVPALVEISQRLPKLSMLGQRIDDTLEASGAVKDSASSALAEARQKVRRLKKSISEVLDQFLIDPQSSEWLQDSYYSVRNDRFVLPIKASHQSRVPGIVHNASQTGQTLFIEPQTIVDRGNELAIAEAVVREEERRVLAELSADVGNAAEVLRHFVGVLGHLDLIFAQADLAQTMRARIPKLLTDTGTWDFRELRHPLLALQHTKEIVANDVSLDENQHVLIVSGPNAGGKTVTLTGVGLCLLMVRAGLLVPASDASRVPAARGLIAAVGDAQDLERGLSSFSGHLMRLREVCETVEPGWVALVDEICADTDPAEGAALARGCLEYWIERGAKVVASTHLEEVKALGITDGRFANAKVGVDATSGRPTYKLHMGAAGSSSALNLAQQLQLPDDVVLRAREIVRRGGSLSEALDKLAVQKADLEAKHQELQKEIVEAQEVRRRSEMEIEQLRNENRESERKMREDFVHQLAEQQQQVSNLIAKLQAAPRLKDAQKVQESLKSTMQAQHEKLREIQRTPPADTEFVPGMPVEVLSYKTRGEIVLVDEDAALVALGTLRIRVGLGDLKPVPGWSAKGQVTKSTTKTNVARKSDAEPAQKLDLRGFRGDDALREVDRFIDENFLLGQRIVVILHGHGTGILKTLIREHLQQSPYVKTSRRGEGHEGGDAVTVLELALDE